METGLHCKKYQVQGTKILQKQNSDPNANAYLVLGTWYIVLFSQIRNLHMRFDQVRTRFGHNFSGFLADVCFPMVQI